MRCCVRRHSDLGAPRTRYHSNDSLSVPASYMMLPAWGHASTPQLSAKASSARLQGTCACIWQLRSGSRGSQGADQGAPVLIGNEVVVADDAIKPAAILPPTQIASGEAHAAGACSSICQKKRQGLQTLTQLQAKLAVTQKCTPWGARRACGQKRCTLYPTSGSSCSGAPEGPPGPPRAPPLTPPYPASPPPAAGACPGGECRSGVSRFWRLRPGFPPLRRSAPFRSGWRQPERQRELATHGLCLMR